jgi:hypothetical protein
MVDFGWLLYLIFQKAASDILDILLYGKISAFQDGGYLISRGG